MGIVAEQVHYMLNGSTTTKNQITHNQTFWLLQGSESVNTLTDMSQYPPMKHRFCYLRMVHQIIALRRYYLKHESYVSYGIMNWWLLMSPL
jgi:hypothetical protein